MSLPPVVEPADGTGGLPKVVMRSAGGATAEVYLQGAHVTSWRPERSDEERLFLSTLSEFRKGVAIRGGIPVIFPQFATEGPLPRHGFARTSDWMLVGAEDDSGGDVVASFSLADSLATRTIWPASFLAMLMVRVGGDRLDVALSVENTGATPLTFTAALHTYARVHDARHAEVVGLRDVCYRESSAPAELKADRDEAVRIPAAMDRVYVGAPRRLLLREPLRQLAVETVEFPDVVIWNPGSDAASGLKDMEHGGERRMLCVEAAAVQLPITLEAGRRWSGSQTLIALPRDDLRT